jgi:hypothetical protein
MERRVNIKCKYCVYKFVNGKVIGVESFQEWWEEG